MKTKSPAANNGDVNPKIGVVSIQVAIPALLVLIEDIPTPFELLIATNLCGSDSNPNNGPNSSTSDIDPLGALATSEVASTISPLVSFQRIKSGSLRYLAPPYTISIFSIVSKSSKVKIGGTNASGLSVLSDG